MNDIKTIQIPILLDFWHVDEKVYKNALKFHWESDDEGQTHPILSVDGIWDPDLEGVLGDGKQTPDCYMMPAEDKKAQRQLKVCINMLESDVLIYRDLENCDSIKKLIKIVNDIVNGAMLMTFGKKNPYLVKYKTEKYFDSLL